MRVLLVTHRFPPTGVAGVERITQSLAAELARDGVQVSVLTRAATSAQSGRIELLREYLPDGTCVYRLTGQRVGVEQFLDSYASLEQHMTQVMVEQVPDVVHILQLQDLSPRFPEIAYRHGAALVYSLQDFYYACHRAHLLKPGGELCDGPRGGQECAATCFAHDGTNSLRRWGLRTLYFRRLLELAQRFIAPSRYTADYFERYGLDPARMEIIPNAVFFPVPTPRVPKKVLPQVRGRLHLAFLGSIIPHKGLHVLFQALQLARLGPVKVLVLGRTHGQAYETQLRQSAAVIPDLTLDWHGEYEPDELPLLLQDTDCLVMPSFIRETFGIVIHEAFALGIPALVSNTGSQPELIREGENGFTFDVNHPAALGALLYRLAHDDALMAKLFAGAAQTPVMQASSHAAAVRGVYQKALAERLPPQFTRSVDKEERDWLFSALLQEGFAGFSD